jgi:hypothetical protein
MESVSEDVGVAGRNPGDSNCSLGSSGSQPFFRLPRPRARDPRGAPQRARSRERAAGDGGGGGRRGGVGEGEGREHVTGGKEDSVLHVHPAGHARRPARVGERRVKSRSAGNDRVPGALELRSCL